MIKQYRCLDLFKFICAVLIAFLPGVLIGKFIHANDWIMFGVESIIYCAIYAVIMYFIGACGEEKRYILKIIKRKSIL